MHVVTLQGADSRGAAMLHDPIRTAGRLRERDDCIQACRSVPMTLCLKRLRPAFSLPCPRQYRAMPGMQATVGAPPAGSSRAGYLSWSR